jgi:F-type H+-transporting ATPase subunit epsilon
VAATESGQRTFDLSVVTPEGSVFDGEAQMLVVPGAAGEIGVLARHAPLVAMLKAGEIRVKAGNEWQSFAAGPGFFKVQRDRAIVLVDDAVKAGDIDIGEARRDLEEARDLLERAEAGEEGIDRWLAEQRVRHAQNKIDVAGGREASP